MKIYSKDGLTFLEMIKPSNFHVHWRELSQLQFTVPWSARQFYYVLGMLNTTKPLTNPLDASNYCIEAQRIGSYVNIDFIALVSLYLTDDTTPADIYAVAQSDNILSVKGYPAGATTNSSKGITSWEKVYTALAVMEEKHVPLCVHGEVTDPKIALWDRERVFVDSVLTEIHKTFPQLRIILEHVSTKEGAQFVESTPSHIGGTVAPHYMLCNCNDVYLRPTRNCFPVINSPRDQKAIINLAINCQKVFAGTDSAPHPTRDKFCDCGKGGCCVEPYAPQLYAGAFTRAGAMDERFEQFMSLRGPRFYELNEPKKQIVLVKKPIQIPTRVPTDRRADAALFMAGEVLQWQHVD